ncbi:MAG: carboxypeptidase-like regulatory domain-containing protein [Planctomycetota bacterium]|nr:carboxypeptidase-like regulatory domain-containing protein [Planctomycetota bacterium]
MKPDTRRSPRRGASQRTLLAGMVLTVAVVVTAAWFLLEGDGGARVAGVEGGPGDVSPATPDLLGEELVPGAARSSAGADVVLLGGEGEPIPVGVRLGGVGRLEGRVLERATGDELAGVRVDLTSMPPAGQEFLRRIYRAAKFDPRWVTRLKPIAVTATDAAGRFVFEGVRPGNYFVETRSLRHVPDQPVIARVDSAGNGGPIEVYVRAGGRVVGTVRTSDGRSVAGAVVAVYPGAASFLTAARTGDLRDVFGETDAEGRYMLTGVPPGDGYDVAVAGHGFAVTHRIGLSVAAGEDTVADVTVRVGATVTGRVVAEEPGEPGADGAPRTRPLAGAHVGALPRGLRDLAWADEILQQTHAVTDADGRYVMRNVPPGEIDVVAAAVGYVPSRSATVHLAEGMSAEAEPIALCSGPLVTIRFVDSAGVPIPEVNTSWFVVDWDDYDFEPSLTPLMIQAVEGFEYPRSDADGVLVAGPFPGDPPHAIFVMAEGHEFKIVEWHPEKDGREIEVVLSKGGGIEGIVMDAVRAEPIPAFMIGTATRLDREYEAPSTINPFSGGEWIEDENGRFRMSAMAPGDNEVFFSAPGYLREHMTIQVATGEITRGLIVKLRPGGTIRGRVVDAEGEPVPGAQVAPMDERGRAVMGRLHNPRARVGSPKDRIGQEIAMGSMEFFSALGVVAVGFVVTDSDGRFEVTCLPERLVVLHVTQRDFADAKSEPIRVVAGDPVEDVEVVLSRGGGIYGTISDRHGRPVPNAIVLAFSPTLMSGGVPSARWVHQGGSNRDGEYRIEHMEPGSYILVASRGDEALNLVSFFGTLNFDLVTVPPDQMVRFDLVDSSAAGCRVHGHVLADGERVSGGGLFALGFGGENVLGLDVKIAQVKDDGSYEFAGLAPGAYQFTYRGKGPEVRMDVEIPDLPELFLELELPGGGVKGRVVDASTREPLRGAEVVLRRDEPLEAGGFLGGLILREGRSARDWTNRDGEFSFRRLQAGTYQLTVGPPRWGEAAGRYAPPEPLAVEVEEGLVRTDLEILLEPSLELVGFVRAADGAPVGGARVLAFTLDDVDVRPSRARTDGAGRFALRSLAPGSYAVTATADDYADAPAQEVEIAAGPNPEIEIVLYRGTEVKVWVFGPDGEPVQGATGRLVPRIGPEVPEVASLDRTIQGLFSGQGLSGPQGLLHLGRYAPGEYRLEVRRGSLAAVEEPVRLEQGPPVELEVRLQ